MNNNKNDKWLIKHNATKYEIQENGYFKITGSIPSQDDIYEIAMNHDLKINEKIFDVIYEIIGGVDFEEIIVKLQNFFKRKMGKEVKISYSESSSELVMTNSSLTIPISSKNSGTLGSVTILGRFTIDEALGFLAFYDSFVSVVEGLIISYRLEQLLKSALDTVFVTLNKRVRLDEDELKTMQKIALTISEHEHLNLEEVELALRTVNVGFVGIRDDLFERIRAGVISKEDYQEFLKHVDYGYEILKDMEAPTFIIDACLYHHEFINGSGPMGLKEKEIPKLALIVGFAEHVVLLKWEESELEGKYPDYYLELLKRLRGDLS
ncbi:HD-GYP domain-containing protein [Fervidobacterium sp.]